MAIMDMDNFSLYGTGTTGRDLMLNGLYAVVTQDSGLSILNAGTVNSIVADPDVTSTGNVFRIGNTRYNTGVVGGSSDNGNLLRRNLPTNLTTVGIAQRIYFSQFSGSGDNLASIIASFRGPGNEVLFHVEVGATGQIICWRGTMTYGASNGTLTRSTILAQTTGPVIVANAWQHVEIKAVFNNTTGSIQIKVNGVDVINATGLNTDPSSLSCAAISWFNYSRQSLGSTAPIWYLKDVVRWNTSGTYNNDFIGAVAVYTLLPDADDSLNWTPVGDTVGWRILDNVPPDDTDYIEADTTPPAAYVATLTNLPPDLISIRGLQTTIRARTSDGGDGQVQVGLISGVSTQLLTDRQITPAWTFWTDISEEDPATAAAWTPSAVDDVKVQVDRTV